MQAAHQNNVPTNDAGGLAFINPVASVDSLDSARLPVAANSSLASPASPALHRKPFGETLKVWGPVVVTAIVVPGGIVIALAILARRWYRNRVVRPATFA